MNFEIHRAGHILVTPWHMVENGYISVENNTIADISSGKSGAIASAGHNIIDHGPGILMPALVNAHVHFELSALKGRVPFDRGFSGWVRELLIKRGEFSTDLLRQEARKAIKSAVSGGTRFFGEISTLGITEDMFTDSDIGGVWFQEYLGAEEPLSRTILTPPTISRADSRFSSDGVCKERSMAGHAPHTTSPELLMRLKEQSRSAALPFSIHVAESSDETEFITTRYGRWAHFLKERGIDFSAWPLPSRSPVHYLNDMGLLDPLTLVVHLLNVDSDDIEIIAKTGAKPVFCPRSNFNLHRTLPDIPLFLRSGLKPALGSDSLASTESLSMFDEMAFVAANFPDISPCDILAMATVNGATALGFEKRAGALERGKQAAFIYVPVERPGYDIEDMIMDIIMTNTTPDLNNINLHGRLLCRNEE